MTLFAAYNVMQDFFLKNVWDLLISYFIWYLSYKHWYFPLISEITNSECMCNFHIWLCKYGKQNSNFILVIYAIFFLFQPTVTNKSVKNFLNRHINEGLKQNFHFDLELICF